MFASLPMLSWFDIKALNALFNLSFDRAGNLIFVHEDTVIYPFTYVGSLISFFGVSYYVMKCERRIIFLAVAILAARASTVGMVSLYEFIYVGLGDLVWRAGVWSRIYAGDLISSLWKVAEMTWILAVSPWWRWENLRYTVYLFVFYLGAMLVWLSLGFPSVDSGSGVAYFLNALTRLTSHLVIVVSVRN